MNREFKLCRDCKTLKSIADFTCYQTELGRRFRPYCKPCASKRTLLWWGRVSSNGRSNARTAGA